MKAVKTTVLMTMSLCAVIAYAQNASRTSDTSADEAALLAADDAFTRANIRPARFRAGPCSSCLERAGRQWLISEHNRPAPSSHREPGARGELDGAER